jgi:hypothetical protein
MNALSILRDLNRSKSWKTIRDGPLASILALVCRAKILTGREGRHDLYDYFSRLADFVENLIWTCDLINARSRPPIDIAHVRKTVKAILHSLGSFGPQSFCRDGILFKSVTDSYLCAGVVVVGTHAATTRYGLVDRNGTLDFGNNGEVPLTLEPFRPETWFDICTLDWGGLYYIVKSLALESHVTRIQRCWRGFIERKRSRAGGKVY